MTSQQFWSRQAVQTYTDNPIAPGVSFQDYVQGLDRWGAVDVVTGHMCFDRVLRSFNIQRTLLRFIPDLQRLWDENDGKFMFIHESPGGNMTTHDFRGYQAIAWNALEMKQRVRVTHILLQRHTPCKAEKAHTAVCPYRAAKDAAYHYLSAQRLYPGLFVGRPKLALVEVDTLGSDVTGVTAFEDEVWSDAQKVRMDKRYVREMLAALGLLEIAEGDLLDCLM